MYREKIRVFDCTIRDGGLINDHDFTHEFVRNVYKALSEAGVDYMEIGYKNSSEMFSGEQYGTWKFCHDDDISRVIEGIESKVKLSVMVDVGRVNLDDIKPASQSPIKMIRTAAYVKEIDKAIYYANHFHEKGYETTINIMAISKDKGPELDEALHQIRQECKADVIYIVDSFGSLYQESVDDLVKRFKKILTNKEVGFHGHNNQQLGFSNTIEAIMRGANYLDATVYGIGRGAGNCPLELLIGFLKNPKFDIRPILDIISSQFLPLSKKIEWGYILPYAIAGMFNEHPRAAIAVRKTDKKDNYREFYDSITGTGVDDKII